jgi:hypothetical protein
MTGLRWTLAICALSLVAGGCDEPIDTPLETAPPDPELAVNPPETPAPLETITTQVGDLTLWPYTGTDVIGTRSDPINLVLVGETDLRALRAALMFLDGDRSAFKFPATFPFDCTWTDAIGNAQTAYTPASGWSGSAVQLECGSYETIRFHLRLFDAGPYALANAHFETIIPGTTDHQVLSWELAEQLVVADFVRTGLLDQVSPVLLSCPISPSPFREIPPIIYNGLPPGLQALTSGPSGPVSEPVPLVTDGQATILNVAGAAVVEHGVVRQELTIDFDQVIPKPFCASGPGYYLYVNGPVDLVQVVRVTPGGLQSLFRAAGTLALTPVDPSISPPAPVGETYKAQVRQRGSSSVSDEGTLVSDWGLQLELPPEGPYRGKLVTRLHVGPGSSQFSELTIECGS